jgi:predicted transcriptional regulator
MAAALETKVITAHVPLPLAQRVDQLAARFDRSRGWIMKQALEAWVDQEEERSRLTRDAMDDVDNGRFVDHEAVVAWSASLNTKTPLPVPVLPLNSALPKI